MTTTSRTGRQVGVILKQLEEDGFAAHDRFYERSRDGVPRAKRLALRFRPARATVYPLAPRVDRSTTRQDLSATISSLVTCANRAALAESRTRHLPAGCWTTAAAPRPSVRFAAAKKTWISTT